MAFEKTLTTWNSGGNSCSVDYKCGDVFPRKITSDLVTDFSRESDKVTNKFKC